jgi:hypothetical protein
MCNHYRHAILESETIPACAIDQLSEIKSPIRFHNMSPDVFADCEGLVAREGNDLVFASIN